jgi:hypothetical protein
MQALQVFAGPRARLILRERGLRAPDVALVPAAAGGPTGLVLLALDRFIFGTWLAGTRHTVHLLGASIGALRMAAACMPDPRAALARLEHDYVHQHYEHEPTKRPAPRQVSTTFAAQLAQRFGGHERELLSNPRFRLHLFATRGRHLLARESRLRMQLGYLSAFAANALSRRAMGGWLERVILSDPRDPLPLRLHDFRTRVVALDSVNLHPGLLASCSIPFWFDAVRDIPGAPRGAYWDGGITDYHLRLNYASMPNALVLYPHFEPRVLAGWPDQWLRHRHRAGDQLSNVVLLVPHPQWISSLPQGRLPDRGDFMRYLDDWAGRVAFWQRAVRESERLVQAFVELVSCESIDALPLR